MVYEVISPRGRGTGNIVGVHTESPQCIDSLDMQKAMVAGGSKITFEGTEEEYEAVKDKLHPKTNVASTAARQGISRKASACGATKRQRRLAGCGDILCQTLCRKAW